MKETYFLVLDLGIGKSFICTQCRTSAADSLWTSYIVISGVIQDVNNLGGHRCLEKQFLYCRMSKNDEDSAAILGTTLSGELNILMFTSHQLWCN